MLVDPRKNPRAIVGKFVVLRASGIVYCGKVSSVRGGQIELVGALATDGSLIRPVKANVQVDVAALSPAKVKVDECGSALAFHDFTVDARRQRQHISRLGGSEMPEGQ